MNGVPLMVVAKNLGHADTRMVEKHYGHLAPSFIIDAIHAGAPRLPERSSPPSCRCRRGEGDLANARPSGRCRQEGRSAPGPVCASFHLTASALMSTILI